MKFPTATLSDLASSEKGSISMGPFGSRMKADVYVEAGVPVIRGTNIGKGRRLKGDWVYVTNKFADGISNCIVRAGDLVFPHRGSIGEVAIIPKGSERIVLSSSMMKIRVDNSKCNPLFLYYFFKADMGRNEILRFGSQVGTPGIGQPLTSLRQFTTPLPDLAIQNEIAVLLAVLDDKIELNRKMNEVLEGMARAVFRDWFVDFGPTRRKMAGEVDPLKILGGAIASHPQAQKTAALFPDRLGKNGLPEGWEESDLGSICKILDNKRIPLSKRERQKRKGHIPYHGATSVMDHVDDFIFDGIFLLIGEDGSVAKENGNPFSQYVWGKIWVNNHAHVLEGTKVSTETLKCFFDQMNILPFITGAVQLKLNQKNMKSIPFILADTSVNKAFGEFISPLFANIRLNAEENQTLAEMRDLLLPKLMSGEIRLREGG
ncbi:MAG: restriction endonuclease subunit S [Rhodobacteraceae bacterium]|nr:restriction endonuclease subunit S [Paracoccaceae bacterium]